MSWRQRRSDYARHLQSWLQGNEQQIGRGFEGETALRKEIAQIKAQPGSPSQWEREHPHTREQLKAAEQALDRALDARADRAIEHPGEHITRVLGERPSVEHAPEREAWEQGARAVERYRIAYDIDPAEQSALGSKPNRVSISWEQRGDWDRAGKSILDARAELGLERSGLGPIEERLARVMGVMPEQDRQRELDRGHGWEL